MTLLLQLLLAHLLGDFLLQPNRWVKAKESRKAGAYQLYLHVLLHYVLTMLLVWDLGFWLWGLGIALSHLFIDIWKLYAQQQRNRRNYFFADQALHLLVLILAWIGYSQIPFDLSAVDRGQFFLIITTLVLLTKPLSITIKTLISTWTPYTERQQSDSLENAGKYIGYLERVLVFVFIVSNHWEAVGFLITAKSVFRFGDLKASRERKLTEYVLIGTLLSFGAAICIALLYLQVQYWL